MIRPERLSLLKIAIHETSISQFLNEIPKYPYFQIRDLSESESGKFYEKMYHERSILSKDIDMLNHKVNEIEENLISLFQNLEIDPDDIEKPRNDEKYELEVDNVEELVDILHEQTENESRRVKNYFQSIKQYEKDLDYTYFIKKAIDWLKKFSINREILKWFDQYVFKLFFIDRKEYDNFLVGLEHEDIPRAIQSESITEDKTVFFIITHEKHSDQIDEIVNNFGGEKIENLPDYIDEEGINTESLEEDIDFYLNRIERSQELIKDAKSKTRRLKYRAFLEILENIRIYIRLERKFYSSSHKQIVHLEAFVPRKDQDKICKELFRKFEPKIKIVAKPVKRACAYEEEGKKGSQERREDLKKSDFNVINKMMGRKKKQKSEKVEEVGYKREEEDIYSNELDNLPSLVKTPKMFRPFRRLVDLYGIPNYSEVDPTPVFAFTFSFLFGLMFGDVGHGIVFVIIGFILIFLSKKPHIKDSFKDFGYIFIWMGVSSVIGGFIYGEFFGHHIIINGEPFVLFANPLENIIDVLQFAILIGVAHLSLGWLIAGVNYILNKRIYLAFVDPFLKIVLISCGTYLIFNWGFEIMVWLQKPYPILLALVPAIGLILGKPIGKIVFNISYLQDEDVSEMLGEATIDVGETYLSILSNVASYSRILALAMAHIGLMLMVTTVAELLSDIRWIVIIGGNAFVILLEGIIASIHSLRLQFYEFFGKFFLADGVAYESEEVKNEYSLVEFSKV